MRPVRAANWTIWWSSPARGSSFSRRVVVQAARADSRYPWRTPRREGPSLRRPVDERQPRLELQHPDACLGSASSWTCSSRPRRRLRQHRRPSVTDLAFQLRLELHVLGHDGHLRPGLALGARPPVLLQPADHPHAPSLRELFPADFREPRPGGDIEVRDLRTGWTRGRNRRLPPPSACPSAQYPTQRRMTRRGRRSGAPRKNKGRWAWWRRSDIQLTARRVSVHNQ